MLKRLLIIAIALSVTPFVSQAKEVTLKFTFFGPPVDPNYSRVMMPWADRINADGKGIVNIKAFPSGALGRNPRTQLKMVQDKVAEIGFVVPSYTPGRFPDDTVMELPNLYKTGLEAMLVYRHLYKKGMLRGYDKFYVPILASTVPYSIHATKPIKSVDDIKGLKLRAGGPVAGAAIRALGAVPVGMSILAVAENISKGIINGTAGDWHVLFAFRIMEAAKHHYLAQIGTVPVSVLLNREVYDGLSSKARAIIDKHSGEIMSRHWGEDQDAREVSSAKKAMSLKDHTIVTPDAGALKAWRARLQPIVDKWENEHPNGKAIMAEVRAKLKALRAK